MREEIDTKGCQIAIEILRKFEIVRKATRHVNTRWTIQYSIKSSDPYIPEAINVAIFHI